MIFALAFGKDGTAKSRFYGFPIARIGVLYSAAQVPLSFLTMALAGMARIRKQADELASSKSELREKSRRLASAESVSLLSKAERIKGIAVVCSVMDGSTANDLKLTADELCKKDSTVPCVSLLFAPNAG